VVENADLPGCSSLSALTYNSSSDVQKFITLRLFIVSVRVNNCRKDKGVFYNSCMGLPPQIPATVGSGLNFLTTAHSQVGFDIAVRNYRFEVFLVDLMMATRHDASTS
jgi:hypothetical protein